MSTSRLAVLMVADVVGYSRMMAEDEKAAIGVVQELNEAYVAPQACHGSGEVLKRMGDGWIVAFGSVTAGIECATSLLQKLAGFKKAQIRIGSHIGEIVEDGEDFYGAGLNLAARLQSEAPPGGLMISQDLFRQLTGEAASEFQSAGTFELKNIPYPVEGYQWRPVKPGAAPEDTVPSILVEQFRAAPADADTESMASDLREQILMNLASRTGVKALDGRKAATSDPTYTLGGGVRRSGSNLRMNVSLTLSATGEALFSKNYQGDVTEFFEFADDLVTRVNADMRIQLNAFDGNRLAHMADEDLSASELRSRAGQCFYQGGYKDWSRAADLMDRALALNPNDPMALAMRATAKLWLANARYQRLSGEEADSIERDIQASIEANPKSDFALQTRAAFHACVLNDAQACLRDSNKALALTPDYQIALATKSMGQTLSGDFEGAVKTLERALDVAENNPLKAVFLFPLAVNYFCAGAPEKAAVVLGDAIDLKPNIWGLYRMRAAALEKAGDPTGAKLCEERASMLPPKPEIATGKPTLPSGFEDLIQRLTPSVPD